jgi:hypothetical protein
MELVVEPDNYMPSIDELGNYVDKMPAFKKGLMCPCGSRKDKVYETTTMFSAHIKTKTHQKWIADLNLNKANLYIENKDLNDLVKNQRLIIAKAESEINNLRQTITYLTKQLNNSETKVVATNLLEFD